MKRQTPAIPVPASGAKRARVPTPMEVLGSSDNVDLDASSAVKPKHPLSVVLTDEETGAEDLGHLAEEAQKLGEGIGEPVILSGSAAHPFTQACFMLKLTLGLYGVLATTTPLFVSFASDPFQTELILDSVALILAVFIAYLFHHAMLEELLVHVRAFGTREAQGKVGGRLHTAVASFSISFLVELIFERIEAYSGAVSMITVWLVALSSLVFVLLAILMVVRQQVLFKGD